jgi:hypothetical protein
LSCKGFNRAAGIGRSGERMVRELFASNGVPAVENQSEDRTKLSKHDFTFELAGRQHSVEVKRDLFEKRTGNVAVEFYNPVARKPSGLAASTSSLWAFVLSDGIWACSTATLRRVFEQGMASPAFVRDVKAGGDGNADFRLYKRAVLFPGLFFRLNDHSGTEFTGLLTRLLNRL